MGYVLLVRDETGAPSYINKVFATPEECFAFAKTHNIREGNYEIVTQEEFQAYMQSEQQSQQRYQRGYQQHVSIIDDQREPEPEPRRPIPVMLKNYHPQFISFKKVRR
jgi:hypothetical protein